MENIETKAMHIYKNNLSYLEEYHKILYDKINLLSILIAEGKYVEKYALEYMEGDYFDIRELANNTYLYETNSLIYSQQMVNLIDLKRVGAVFKALKDVSITDAQAELIDKSQLSFHNLLWATAKVINYHSLHTSFDILMNSVKKVMFLGIGLGLHIEKIVEKLHSQVLFIKEENIEIFYLSLFITDYKQLANNRFIYFSITDDILQERQNFLQFLDKGNNYNLNIKHVPFFNNYESALRRLQGHVLSQSYINYGYSAMLFRFIESPKYIAKGYNFLEVTKRYTDNIISQKPILLLFSGPSTSNNIQWIQENHKRFIIVSALSTCRLLNTIDISPDIVIHMDPGEATSLLFEGLEDIYFEATTVILSSNVNEEAVKKFNSRKIYFIEQGTNYKKNFGRLSAPSVGEYAYALTLIFGALKIYMLGIDLALDPKTLQTHGNFHIGQTQGIENENNAFLDPGRSIEYIRGNFSDSIPTIASYKLSVEQFEIFTDILKKENHEVYNLSNGAYLEGSQPLHIEEYDWKLLEELDKEEISLKLKLLFEKISSSEFRDEDKAILKYQIKEAKKLKKIIQKHQKKKYANVESYLNTLSQLSWDLSDMDYKTNSDLAQVYYEYFPIILSYIFDLFNTQVLENPPKRVIEVDKILVKQLMKICDLYITKMESYFKL